MAIKRVFLHLGMTKAGSSSIQSALRNNTAILEKNGFKYPVELGRFHLKFFKHVFSPHPVNPIGSGRLGKPVSNITKKRNKALNKILRIINTTDCEILVLSGEYIYELCSDPMIENLKVFIKKHFQDNAIETNIIYMVRNPLTWIISSLQQQVLARGYLNKDSDFFETSIKQYEGIINLQKHFPDSLIVLKFEDACLNEDGLVGCFLKTINFPKEELANIKTSKNNESRCMEVMEFVNYIEAVEPRYPFKNYRRVNPNRYNNNEMKAFRNIKGVKFDLSYQSKHELWNRLEKTVNLLKENTGIDYTGYKIPADPSGIDKEIYSDETILGFLDAFPKLNFVLQKHFLKFFEKKYMETAQVRFKQLHFNGSVPLEIYRKKNTFINNFTLCMKNRLRMLKSWLSEIINHGLLFRKGST